MTERDGPPVCELCDTWIERDEEESSDPEGHPVHADCLQAETDQLAAEHAAVRSGRGDMERW